MGAARRAGPRGSHAHAGARTRAAVGACCGPPLRGARAGSLRGRIESLGEAATDGPAITVRARRPTACGFGAPAECGAHEQASAELERLYGSVRACVPAGLEPDPLPRDFADADAELVEPAWRSFAIPINRYLAAKAFASWISWQARGVVTAVAALWAARAVLRVEAGRQCRTAGRMLDAALLVEAIRQADFLLVHKASSQDWRIGSLRWSKGDERHGFHSSRRQGPGVNRARRVASRTGSPSISSIARIAVPRARRTFRCRTYRSRSVPLPSSTPSLHTPLFLSSWTTGRRGAGHAAWWRRNWRRWLGWRRTSARHQGEHRRGAGARGSVHHPVHPDDGRVPPGTEVGRTSGARPAAAIEAFVTESVGARR